MPEGESRTTAELSAEAKDAISHRGRAFRGLVPAIAGLSAGELPAAELSAGELSAG